MQAWSASCGGGLVLLNDAGPGSARGAGRNVLILGPCPETAAALAAWRGPPGPAVLSFAGSAGMLDEGPELAVERGGVLAAQIDLVVGAADSEPDRLVRWPPSRSSFSAAVIFCFISAFQAALGCQHRTRSTAVARQSQRHQPRRPGG
jgi:hypothetical protein